MAASRGEQREVTRSVFEEGLTGRVARALSETGQALSISRSHSG